MLYTNVTKKIKWYVLIRNTDLYTAFEIKLSTDPWVLQQMSHLSNVIVMNKRKSTFCEKNLRDQKFFLIFKIFEKSKVSKNRPHQKRELFLPTCSS